MEDPSPTCAPSPSESSCAQRQRSLPFPGDVWDRLETYWKCWIHFLTWGGARVSRESSLHSVWAGAWWGASRAGSWRGSPRLAGSSRGWRGSADSEFTWLPRLHLGPIWLCLGSIRAVWDLSAPSLAGPELVWFPSGLVCDLLGPCRGSTGSWDLSGSQPAVLQVDTFGSCLDAIRAREVRGCPVWARLFPEARRFKSPLGPIRAPRVIKLDGLGFLSLSLGFLGLGPQAGQSLQSGARGTGEPGPSRLLSWLRLSVQAEMGDEARRVPAGCPATPPGLRATSVWPRAAGSLAVGPRVGEEYLRGGVGAYFCVPCVSALLSVSLVCLAGAGRCGG